MEQNVPRHVTMIDTQTGEWIGDGTLKEGEYFKKVTRLTQGQKEHLEKKGLKRVTQNH